MNHDNERGHWQQLHGQIKQQWGKLTDDDLKLAEGNAEFLTDRLQERYGIARDEAQKQVDAFQKRICQKDR